VKFAPKTEILIEITVKKQIFSQFSQNRIFHFVKMHPKNYAVARQEHKTSTFAQLFITNQFPIFIMSISGFLSVLLKHFAPIHIFPTTHFSKLIHIPTC
jgi:hypothetical protein